MSAEEGLRRIKAVGRGILLYGGLGGLCLWAAVRLILGRIGLGELFLVIGLPLFVGAVLWVIAYIVEGFVRPTREEH